jgi:hypothetical protein
LLDDGPVVSVLLTDKLTQCGIYHEC